MTNPTLVEQFRRVVAEGERRWHGETERITADLSLADARLILSALTGQEGAAPHKEGCARRESMRGNDPLDPCDCGAAPSPRAEGSERARLTEIINAYDSYRARGVLPAPGQYQQLVAAIDRGRDALAGERGKVNFKCGDLHSDGRHRSRSDE